MNLATSMKRCMVLFSSILLAAGCGWHSTPSLVLSLEGPFAIQLPDANGRLRILIPPVKNHFEPGFDADVDQHLLCPGEYSIELAGHQRTTTKTIPTKYGTKSIAIDIVHMAAPPHLDYSKSISLVLDAPDELAFTGPAPGTVHGEKEDITSVFSAKILLRYRNVQTVKVVKSGDPSCYFQGLPVVFPWSPSTVHLGNGDELRLSLTLNPSKPDGDHQDAEAAYKAIADMLGITRTVDLPKYHPFYGPHNDCLAPMIRAFF